MNTVIFSGGSGNDALIRGLKNIYPGINAKVVLNAYDDGKSTGVCRAITDTLGVSDIRKNHARMYKASNKNPNKNIIEFMESRYNLGEAEDARQNVLNKLDSWGLDNLKEYAINFFNRSESENYSYNDFCIGNIIYAEMFAEIGYESTNKFMCDLMGIDDFVVLNSLSNKFVFAKTESGRLLDEGTLVDWCNPNDKIIDTKYFSDREGLVESLEESLNESAIDAILKADLIVISTGTFWSSIFPTLQFGDLYKYINSSKAKKIWVMNNECDKDSYGVTSVDLAKHLKDLGLNLDDFKILINSDACDELKCVDDTNNFIAKPMGNLNGKHNSDLVARYILVNYYNLDDCYKNIIFDFDDTIWARYERNNEVSIDNVIRLTKLKNSIIISGNSYKSIFDKLSRVFGSNLDGFDLPIWADCNSVLYKNNAKKDTIRSLVLEDIDLVRCTDFIAKYGLISKMSREDTFVKVRPLMQLERILFADLFNKVIGGDLEAHVTGTSSVDIVKVFNSKLEVIKTNEYEDVLYIGDEIDSGNDRDIALACKSYIKVENVEETNAILKLMEVEEWYMD